jgi:dolichyl-phosphate beta-glucosyltransferase
MTLSIVLPAFDEAAKIAQDVESAARFLTSHNLAGEVIVIDDGSSDATSDRARQAVVPPNVNLLVSCNELHRGKGFAVKTGVLASRGEYVLFADCGLTVPFENALPGLRLLQNGTCDLAHGSRKLPESVIRKAQDWDRKILSALFHALVTSWMSIPPELTDTQCGFKMYRGEIARELYKECTTDGFMFDIEIILRALRHGYRVAEFPVEWTCDRDSRISIRRSSRHILKEARFIRRALFKPKNRHRT